MYKRVCIKLHPERKFAMTISKKAIKTFGIDMVYNIIGSLLYGVGIYLFVKTADFAPGGVTGLALVLNHQFGLPIGAVTIALNIPMILISYRIIGKQFIFKSFCSMLTSSLLLDYLFPHCPQIFECNYPGDQLLAALYGGVFCGAGIAMYLMRGSSSGGVDFLTLSIKTLRPHMTIGVLTSAVDITIVCLGGVVFGRVEAALLGMLTTIVKSFVMDKIVYGSDHGKLLLIITKNSKEVAERVMDTIHRGTTSINAIGNYTNEERFVVMCACSRNQVHLAKRAALEADPEAFVMMTDTSEVYGRGFKGISNP